MNSANPHQINEGACNPYRHCAEHEIDEYAFRPYLICGECFHVFKTRAELWRAYVLGFYSDAVRAYRKGWAPPGTGLWDGVRAWLSMPFTRPKSISFCPHCLHDF